LPIDTAEALVVPMLMLPVVELVEVPVSIEILPETDAPPVPEALPVAIVMLLDGVAAVDIAGVLTVVPAKPCKVKLPDVVLTELEPAKYRAPLVLKPATVTAEVFSKSSRSAV